MRSLIYLIVIGAAAYLGYNVYLGKIDIGLPKGEGDSAGASAETATSGTPAGAPTAATAKLDQPKAAPGEKRIAPPGTYYMIDRVSIEHAAGIAAAIPGDQVKLMQKKSDGTMKVTTGKFDFEVKESQVTNDLDIARDAQRRYALTHPVRQL